MFIHKKYLINNVNKDTKEYKSSLKKICQLNLRRASKFNILAILGALECLKNNQLSGNTGIYVCSEYSAIMSVRKVLEDVSSNNMIMPFDFLNINSNNVSFYVAQALQSHGKNMLLNSDELSFEKGLEVALFDLEINEIEDVLIGLVDESLSNIKDYYKYISNTISTPSNDNSGWLYINQIKEKSLAQIEFIYSFNNLEQMQEIIEKVTFDVLYTKQKSMDNINKKNLDSIYSIIDFIDSEYNKMIYVKLDKNNKGYVVSVKK